MDRSQFYQQMAPLDDAALRKALWNLYWRGSAVMRERIEAEMAPAEAKKAPARSERDVDPATVLYDVRRFAELARCGAYLAGDRRVSPGERTRWRLTFGRLAAEARRAVCEEDIACGAEGIETLIDLACELRGFDYFRSADPIEAARFVVSDAVSVAVAAVPGAARVPGLRRAGRSPTHQVGVTLRLDPDGVRLIA